MKILTLVLSLILATVFLGGCGETNSTKAPAAVTTGTKAPDAITTASIVDNEAAFLKAASKDGTWIIAILKDLTISKDIILEGEFTKEDSTDATKLVPAGRKLALYAQDDKRVKTATFTLTAPKLIVKSENSKIQGGTFVGDVYVEAKGFSVVDATVQGNVYFASEELKATLILDKGGKITGVTEVKKQ